MGCLSAVIAVIKVVHLDLKIVSLFLADVIKHHYFNIAIGILIHCN